VRHRFMEIEVVCLEIFVKWLSLEFEGENKVC